MSNRCLALIMAGGQGTRFWPESTSKKPKQYLNLVGVGSLLQQTLNRFDGISAAKDRYIVTVRAQQKLVLEQAKGLIGDDGVIYEPAGRNTAPCILLALAKLQKEAKGDDLVAVVPSDHVILNTNAFKATLDKAMGIAKEFKKIVTIGIKPTFPHTGYGYIERDEKLSDGFIVKAFKEKPDFETAKNYVASSDFYWNAGMFVARVDTFLEEFKKCSPETFKAWDDLVASIDNEKILDEIYNQIPSDSIDYAVMEKSSNIAVIPAEFDWNDLGSWDALESVMDKTDGNTLVGDNPDVFVQNAKGNIVYAKDKFVGLVDVDDLIIVSNDNAVMVLPKSESQKVKKIVEHLKDKERVELL